MAARRPPTIKDVAAVAGVSKSLVSMVLRGDPGVSSSSRAAVEEAAHHLGYRANRAASILAAGRTNTIGVVLDDYRNLWYFPLFNGIKEVLAPQGLRMTAADTFMNSHLGVSAVDDLLSLRVDAVIFACEPPADLSLPSSLPVVLVGDRANRIPSADVVADDEREGGRLATRHLIELGHRHIGHLTGHDSIASRRRAAYEETMRAAGLQPTVVGDGLTREIDGYSAARQLLDRHPEVTALFSANDTMAMGAMGAIREVGRSVPDDVSLIGYDDSPLAASALLQLTTVDARYADTGRVAADRLLSRLRLLDAGAVVEPPATVLLTPRLVQRASTRSPR